MLTKEEIDYYLSNVVIYNMSSTEVCQKVHELAKEACRMECMDQFYAGMRAGEYECGYGNRDFEEDDWKSGINAQHFFDSFGIPYSKEDEPLLKRIVWGVDEILDFRIETFKNSEGAPAFILRNTLTYTVNKEN